MKIQQLEYFMHVVRAQNITRATERAGISQPALSRQIQMLEDELGVSLFQRIPRGVVLTPSGKKLAEHAQDLSRRLDFIKDDVSSSTGVPVGSLCLATSYSLTGMLISPVVARFHALYPQVKVQVIEGTSEMTRRALVTNNADLAIYGDHGSYSGLKRDPFCSELQVLVAPPDTGLSLDKPLSIADLGSLPLIMTPFSKGPRQMIDQALHRHGWNVEPTLTVDTSDLMISLVSDGAGYTILPYSSVYRAHHEAQVSIALISDLPCQWVLVNSVERPLTAAGTALIDLLSDHAGNIVRDGIWRSAQLSGAYASSGDQR